MSSFFLFGVTRRHFGVGQVAQSQQTVAATAAQLRRVLRWLSTKRAPAHVRGPASGAFGLRPLLVCSDEHDAALAFSATCMAGRLAPDVPPAFTSLSGGSSMVVGRIPYEWLHGGGVVRSLWNGYGSMAALRGLDAGLATAGLLPAGAGWPSVGDGPSRGEADDGRTLPRASVPRPARGVAGDAAQPAVVDPAVRGDRRRRRARVSAVEDLPTSGGDLDVTTGVPSAGATTPRCCRRWWLRGGRAGTSRATSTPASASTPSVGRSPCSRRLRA